MVTDRPNPQTRRLAVPAPQTRRLAGTASGGGMIGRRDFDTQSRTAHPPGPPLKVERGVPECRIGIVRLQMVTLSSVRLGDEVTSAQNVNGDVVTNPSGC